MSPKKVKDVHRSTYRYMLSYLILGIFTLIPLGLEYIPGINEIFSGETVIFRIPFGEDVLVVSFVKSVIPKVISSVIGVSGGFLIWCYYTRTRCLPEQVPGSILLGTKTIIDKKDYLRDIDLD